MKKLRAYSYCVIVFSILMISCGKKKREAIEGVYKGIERYVHIGPYGDTSHDESYIHQIELKIQDNRHFLLTKETYPFSHELSAGNLVEDGTDTKWQTFPQEIWTVRIVGDSLYGSFKENDNWAGSKDHYLFEGIK
ncbi:MAG: hypothetical protein GQ574_12460 [Crocinitomix sp.]|nr:hypothetical protein [Crocinitomix sp.]